MSKASTNFESRIRGAEVTGGEKTPAVRSAAAKRRDIRFRWFQAGLHSSLRLDFSGRLGGLRPQTHLWNFAGAAFLLLLACGGVPPGDPSAQAADTYSSRRAAMVRQQIEARGVSDRHVLEAMRKVPRHLFVPPQMVDEAYNDYPLPIGSGQTISQPYIVAFMSELLEVEKDHKVLEIGTGCGYQAAVLSLLGGEIYSIEIVEDLGVEARQRLEKLGYDNVQVRIGNGYLGWPEAAPFERIILTAAPNEVPQALIDQLKPRGRLVAPVGPVYGNQELVVVTKNTAGEVRTRSVLPVRFVPMVEEPE